MFLYSNLTNLFWREGGISTIRHFHVQNLARKRPLDCLKSQVCCSDWLNASTTGCVSLSTFGLGWDKEAARGGRIKSPLATEVPAFLLRSPPTMTAFFPLTSRPMPQLTLPCQWNIRTSYLTSACTMEGLHQFP